MRRFFIEDSVDYSRYRFSYRPMAELESLAELPEIYAAGFLPASGDPSEPRHLFYLARSLRYDLAMHALDKKRRYDFRRVGQLEPRFGVMPQSEAIKKLPEGWRAQAFRWMEERFGSAYLTSQRLDYVWNKPYCSHLAIASCGGQPFAYVLLAQAGNIAHYWYAFFNSAAYPHLSLGKWLMARTAQWAREAGLAYLYVGTGYGSEARYKAQGVAGVEFFDGERWNRGRAELDRRQAGDPRKKP